MAIASGDARSDAGDMGFDGLDISCPISVEISRGDEVSESEAMKSAQAEAEVFSDKVKGSVDRGGDTERHNDSAFTRRSDPSPVGGCHDGTCRGMGSPTPDYDQRSPGR